MRLEIIKPQETPRRKYLLPQSIISAGERRLPNAATGKVYLQHHDQ